MRAVVAGVVRAVLRLRPGARPPRPRPTSGSADVPAAVRRRARRRRAPTFVRALRPSRRRRCATFRDAASGRRARGSDGRAIARAPRTRPRTRSPSASATVGATCATTSPDARWPSCGCAGRSRSRPTAPTSRCPCPNTSDTAPRSCAPRSLPTRLRVNSSRPRFENDWIVARVRSRRKPSSSALMTLLRDASDAMSMKSTTMMPPMSRRRTWRASLLGRFDVRLEDRVLEVAAAGELAGVDVDDRQRLGRFDDDRPARRQVDLGFHQLLQLFVDLDSRRRATRPEL